MSATADAAHFGGCKGTVSLEDCTFEGMGDDGVNVKSGLYLTVVERAISFHPFPLHASRKNSSILCPAAICS